MGQPIFTIDIGQTYKDKHKGLCPNFSMQAQPIRVTLTQNEDSKRTHWLNERNFHNFLLHLKKVIMIKSGDFTVSSHGRAQFKTHDNRQLALVGKTLASWPRQTFTDYTYQCSRPKQSQSLCIDPNSSEVDLSPTSHYRPRRYTSNPARAQSRNVLAMLRPQQDEQKQLINQIVIHFDDSKM